MAAFEIRDLSFTYPNENKPALDNITLSIPEGRITLICGASGSGKSTLLRRLKTCLADHGKAEGEVLFFGKALDAVGQAEQARRIGFVFQHPDDQIVTDKVFHELAFGPESLGWDQARMRLAVAEMASYFGLDELFFTCITVFFGSPKAMSRPSSSTASMSAIGSASSRRCSVKITVRPRSSLILRRVPRKSAAAMGSS